MIGLADRVATIVTSPGFMQATAAELRALLVHLMHADAEGVSRPSVRRVAELIGVQRRGAQKVHARLLVHGLLQVVGEGGGRSRATRYLVAPTATARCLGDCLRRETASPPDAVSDGNGVQSGRGIDAGNSVLPGTMPEEQRPLDPETASAGPRNGVPPGRPNTRTPEHLAGARATPAAGDAPPNVDLVTVDAVDQAVELLAGRGWHHRARFVAAARCRGFLEAGGTLVDLGRLAKRAEVGRSEGLLWHWLTDPSRWRAELDDADRIRSETSARRIGRAAAACDEAVGNARRWSPSTPADALRPVAPGKLAPWLRVRRAGGPSTTASILTPAAAQGRTERRAQAVHA